MFFLNAAWITSYSIIHYLLPLRHSTTSAPDGHMGHLYTSPPLPATGSVAAISAAAGFIEGRLTPFRPRPSLLVALPCSSSATPSPRFSFIKYAPPRVRLPSLASASPSLCGGALRRPPSPPGHGVGAFPSVFASPALAKRRNRAVEREAKAGRRRRCCSAAI